MGRWELSPRGKATKPVGSGAKGAWVRGLIIPQVVRARVGGIGCLVWADRQIIDCDSVVARRVPRLPGREAASKHRQMLRHRKWHLKLKADDGSYPVLHSAVIGITYSV